MRLALCLASLGALGACGSPPEQALDRYLRALRGKDLDRAYALMSSEYQKGHDRARFARDLSTLPHDGMRRGAVKVRYQASLELGDSDDKERLELVYEQGAWRLVRDPLDHYPQGAPREALRSFLRALENERYDVLLRFVPTRYRGSITVDALRARWSGERRAELLRVVAEVRHHLDEQVDVLGGGDEARLPLADKRQVRLVREDNAWKVEALE